MASDRVDKFLEDAEKLTNLRNLTKIASEGSRLCTWLQKHQYDILPDGSKGKLLQTLVVYHRFYQSLSGADKESFESTISSLFSYYLQLPEGKLLSAKDKKKVMGWLQQLNGVSSASSSAEKASACRLYIVQELDEDSKCMMLQSVDDDTLWLDRVVTSNDEVWATICSRFNETEDTVRVVYDESTRDVVSVKV